ncbi:MAG: alcohol dehydrogenase catalytic domain-containing protein [Gammaproteobacteria bacterium]
MAPAEIETTQPSASQLLVKVAASSMNPIDWKLRNGSLRFLAPVRFPSVPGFHLAGEVVETEAGIRKFKAGERVYACLAERNRGACAEYGVVEENLTDCTNDIERRGPQAPGARPSDPWLPP